MSIDLVAFDEALDHEDFVARVVAVRDDADKATVEIDLLVWSGWVMPGAKTDAVGATVTIRCFRPQVWVLAGGLVRGIATFTEHPALLPWDKDRSRLSYRGVAEDQSSVMAGLLLAHEDEVGQFVDSAHFINEQVSFSVGYGTVADGPTSLIRTFAAVLEAHGLEADVIPIDPLPHEYTEPIESLVVCEIGDGWVVAEAVTLIGNLPDPDEFYADADADADE